MASVFNPFLSLNILYSLEMPDTLALLRDRLKIRERRIQTEIPSFLTGYNKDLFNFPLVFKRSFLDAPIFSSELTSTS